MTNEINSMFNSTNFPIPTFISVNGVELDIPEYTDPCTGDGDPP